jgi:nitroreductase
VSDGDAVLRAIRTRRSVGRVSQEPLPRELVEELIEAAACAPNHRLTNPWRFIVLTGDARREVWERLERAPVVVACVVHPGEDPVEAREDRDAVAAAIENMLLAAHARGLGAMWRTGAAADDPQVLAALGLEDREAVVGFVYIGRPVAPPPEDGPPRRPVAELTTWRGW